jgi:hypothetical protein
MGIQINYIRGDKIGELVYLAPAPAIGKKRQAVFQCRCGVEFITRVDRAKALRVKSCGCSKADFQREAFGTHGLSKHPLYRVWYNMLLRCYNPNTDNYSDYGDRGATVCDEWKDSFEAFYHWAINGGYKLGLELDKDLLGRGSLIYSPSTCCFLTPKENSRHKRNNQFSLLDGVKMIDTDASLKLGHNAKYVSKIRCGASRNKYPNLVLLDRASLTQ